MRALKLSVGTVALLVALAAFGADVGAAAGSPVWSVHSIAAPTNFAPGDATTDDRYEVIVINGGTEVTDGSTVTLTDVLPPGLNVQGVELFLKSTTGVIDFAPEACTTDEESGQATVKCIASNSLPGARQPVTLHPSEAFRMIVHVNVPESASGLLENVVTVAGGGAAAVEAKSRGEASTASPPGGFQEFEAKLVGADGGDQTAAASHPYEYTTAFAVNTVKSPPGNVFPLSPSEGDLRNIQVLLPPGLVGNPAAALKCNPQQFTAAHSVEIPTVGTVFQNECPDGAAVGMILLEQLNGVGVLTPYPIYNLVPPKGMPAQFGFQIAGSPIYIDTKVRTGGDYGITAYLPNTSQARPVGAASVTFWGVPADESHDHIRGHCLDEGVRFSLGTCPAGILPRPFFRLPTSCDRGLSTSMLFDTWATSSIFRSDPVLDPAPVECANVPFAPTISAVPQTGAADSASGLQFNLHVPQHEGSTELATADLRDVTVTLPDGVSINPSSANGLAGCAPEQIDLNGEGPANCPDAAKIGSVEVNTPLLDHPINGAVYVATQARNPFNSLIAIYLVVFDPESGVVLKLAGRVEPDPTTGRITTKFVDNPQLPFEDLRVTFFNGPRAALRTPPRCGPTFTTTSDLRPYSAPDSGPDSTPTSSFGITQGPGGGACPTGKLAPKLAAGMSNRSAGTHSPFSLEISREDGTGEIAAINTTTPTGLSATLKGTPYCSEAGIARAVSRNKPGDGALELASASCSSASQVGTASAAAGAGQQPLYTNGKVYLAGPYKGAPLSLVTMVPAIGGPFDLGVVTVRIALQVNPETAQVTAVSDPFPTILSGIPLDIRDVRVNLDRPNFTLAPTNCEPKTVQATVFGVEGSSAAASQRFQVGGCKSLAFKPDLKLHLEGATKRIGHPALKAVLTYPQGGGYANVARAQVNLPHGEFLDQGNLNKTCTRPLLLAGACPTATIYGHAKAWTPLLDAPLEGPVYLVGGYGYKLPALVAELNGQIKVLLVGKIDSGKNEGIRATFDVVPDAPVSRFVLEMKGGKKYGLLENSEDLCTAKKAKHRAVVRFTGQNGKVRAFKPMVQNECREAKKNGRKKKHARHHKRHR